MSTKRKLCGDGVVGVVEAEEDGDDEGNENTIKAISEQKFGEMGHIIQVGNSISGWYISLPVF